MFHSNGYSSHQHHRYASVNHRRQYWEEDYEEDEEEEEEDVDEGVCDRQPLRHLNNERRAHLWSTGVAEEELATPLIESAEEGDRTVEVKNQNINTKKGYEKFQTSDAPDDRSDRNNVKDAQELGRLSANVSKHSNSSKGLPDHKQSDLSSGFENQETLKIKRPVQVTHSVTIERGHRPQIKKSQNLEGRQTSVDDETESQLPSVRPKTRRTAVEESSTGTSSLDEVDGTDRQDHSLMVQTDKVDGTDRQDHSSSISKPSKLRPSVDQIIENDGSINHDNQFDVEESIIPITSGKKGKSKTPLPDVAKREKKSLEELIQSFKNEKSVIRAPCKEYLDDSLFKEAKLQHHQVLVSTLMRSLNNSFSSSSRTCNEQSTIDIADTEPLPRQRRAKKSLIFASTDGLPTREAIFASTDGLPTREASTPKMNGRAKSKTSSGNVKLFDIEFDDSCDDSTMRSRTSLLSSISLHSHPSGKDTSADVSEIQKSTNYQNEILVPDYEKYQKSTNFGTLCSSGGEKTRQSPRKSAQGSENSVLSDESWKSSLRLPQKEESESKSVTNNVENLDSSKITAGNDSCDRASDPYFDVEKLKELDSSKTSKFNLELNNESHNEDCAPSERTASNYFLKNRSRRNSNASRHNSSNAILTGYEEENDYEENDYVNYSSSPHRPNKSLNRSTNSGKTRNNSYECNGFPSGSSDPLDGSFNPANTSSFKAASENVDHDSSYNDSRHETRLMKHDSRHENDHDSSYNSNFESRFATLNGHSPKCKRSSFTFDNDPRFDNSFLSQTSGSHGRSFRERNTVRGSQDLLPHDNLDVENESCGELEDPFGNSDEVNRNGTVGEEHEQPQEESGSGNRSLRLNKHLKLSTNKGVTIEAMGCELNLGRKVQLNIFGKKALLI